MYYVRHLLTFPHENGLIDSINLVCWDGACLFNDNFLLHASKHFLGYQEYFLISRNAFKAVLLNLYLFGHLGELDSYRNYQGFSNIFPKILDAYWSLRKVRIFLISLFIAFSNPKILRVPFSTRNCLKWEVKSEKLFFRTS